VSKRRAPNRADSAERLCPICKQPFDVERDYPLCVNCESLRHYTDRPCRCESCANPEIFPEAIRARFPGLVLIAQSDDPAGLRRCELSIDTLKPEVRLEFAQAISDLIQSLARQTADEEKSKKGSAK
jgi:hypothetical protein